MSLDTEIRGTQMAQLADNLTIEKELKKRSSSRFLKYQTLKHELLNHEYIFTLHAFPGGNDHGPAHIKRVLEYLDKLLQDHVSALSELELFLLLCSVLLHDQGLLEGRSGHSRASQRLLNLPEYSAHFEPFEMRFIGKIVAVHSAHESIEKEFKGWDEKEGAGGDTVRLSYLAALLRLADELDEDLRRAKHRIFNKILLPDDSVIYWLINMSILAVRPLPKSKCIRVTVEYSSTETDELYVYKTNQRVNVLAAIFRKMQKLNRERQYCLQFMDDGPRFRKVQLKFRDHESGEFIDTVLNDLEDGETFFKDHPELFREEILETEQVSASTGDAAPEQKVIEIAEPKPLPNVHRWDELSDEQRKPLQDRQPAFVSDALEIKNRPHLFGCWELLISGAMDDGHITLQTEIFQDWESQRPIRVQIFPIGKYPLRAPEIAVYPDDRRLAPPALLEQLTRLAVSDVWERQYRQLTSDRLTHIADAIADLQTPVALFRHHASLCEQQTLEKWRLIAEQTPEPMFEHRFESSGVSHQLTIEPTHRYPLQIPAVRCQPVPQSDAWLGTGEPHWKNLSAMEARKLWNAMLKHDNPVNEFVKLIEKLVTNLNAS